MPNIIKYLTLEYISIAVVFAFMLLYCFTFASHGNYTYSVYLNVACIFYLLFHKSNIRNTCLYKLVVLFLLVTVISSSNYMYLDIPYATYLQYLCNSIAPYLVFFTFYNYAARNKDEKFLLLLFVVFFAVSTYYIYYQQGIRQSENIQLNNFYFIITPLPLLFLIKSQTIKNTIFVLSVFCVIISLKRSGFIIVLLLTILMIYNNAFNLKRTRNKLLFIITTSLLIFVAYTTMASFEFDYYGRIWERMDQIENDGGSGRDELFIESVNKIRTFDWTECLIGKGFSAYDSELLNPSGYRTFHNDYSEVTYSFGFSGLILLLLFIYIVFKSCIKLRRQNTSIKLAFYSSFVILIVFTLTSCVFHYFFYMLPLFVFWGYIEPKLQQSRAVRI